MLEYPWQLRLSTYLSFNCKEGISPSFLENFTFLGRSSQPPTVDRLVNKKQHYRYLMYSVTVTFRVRRLPRGISTGQRENHSQGHLLLIYSGTGHYPADQLLNLFAEASWNSPRWLPGIDVLYHRGLNTDQSQSSHASTEPSTVLIGQEFCTFRGPFLSGGSL